MYKRRRAVLLRALARNFPDAQVGGAPVGLFVPVRMPGEARLLRRARDRWIALDGLNEHGLSAQPSGLALGFAASPEATLRRAVKALAALV